MLPVVPKVFETLLVLVEKRRGTVSKRELMAAVWPDTRVEEGSLTQNIFLLRKALGEKPNDHQFIVTVPGRRYQIVADVGERSSRSPAEPPQAADAASRTLAVLPFHSIAPATGDGFWGWAWPTR